MSHALSIADAAAARDRAYADGVMQSGMWVARDTPDVVDSVDGQLLRFAARIGVRLRDPRGVEVRDGAVGGVVVRVVRRVVAP